MLAIILVVISFVTAVVGLVHDYKAKSRERPLLGLTRRGVALMVLACLGMVFGVAKEIDGIRSEDNRTEMLKQIYARVVGVKQATTDPAQAVQLESIADQVYAAASRGGNFRAKDFSGSDFSDGNFTNTNFSYALFRGADLSGADLSTARIDQNTRLPMK